MKEPEQPVNINSSQESNDMNEEDEKNFQNICSDEEEYQNGNFLDYIKHETIKAKKERDFLIN